MRGSWLTAGNGYGALAGVGGICPALTVHVVEALGSRVLRLQVLRS